MQKETSGGTKTSQTIASEEEGVIRRSCLIPVRKRSKRLPNKSKLLINGKPIIWYTIKAAQKSELFTDVIVTSDDEEILEIAYDMGARLHKRPLGLCTDKIQLAQVIRVMLGIVNTGDCVCLMSPCNPLVTADDLKNGYKLFEEKQANYVMSVVPSPIPPERIMRIKRGCLESRKGLKQMQRYAPAYQHDGSFIFFNPQIFLVEFEWGFYGSKNYPYIIEHPSIDIDVKSDYEYAKFLMRGGKK